MRLDDFLIIRFALDNVRPRSLGEGARAAFDRVLNGEAMVTAILAMDGATPDCAPTELDGFTG